MIEELLKIVGPIEKSQLALATLGLQVKPNAQNSIDKIDHEIMGQVENLLKKNSVNVEAN